MKGDERTRDLFIETMLFQPRPESIECHTGIKVAPLLEVPRCQGRDKVLMPTNTRDFEINVHGKLARYK